MQIFRKIEFNIILNQIRSKLIEKLKRRYKSHIGKYLPFLDKMFKKIKSFWYRGENHYCPCCGGRFRIFLSRGTRKLAMCPACGSLERHRLLVLYLKFRTGFFSRNLRVLHFSPIQILQNKFKNMSNLKYVSVDLESDKVMYNMDITNLLFEDNSFDVILCYHVIEHVQHDNLALKELYRVLKPNGWAIIQTVVNPRLKKTFEDPNITQPKARKKFYGHIDHLRVYGKDYINKLEKSGFNVKLDKFVFELNDDMIKRFNINKNEVIYYCSKSV